LQNPHPQTSAFFVFVAVLASVVTKLGCEAAERMQQQQQVEEPPAANKIAAAPSPAPAAPVGALCRDLP
jgi:hypothetical protein